jgi:hypothetical protein
MEGLMSRDGRPLPSLAVSVQNELALAADMIVQVCLPSRAGLFRRLPALLSATSLE